MPKHLLIILILIFSFSFRTVAQNAARDYAWVGGEGSGDFRLGYFKAQQGIGGYHFISGNHWEHSLIDSFRVTVVRDSSLLFYHKNKGNEFDSVLVMRFKGLKVGDRILIHDIWATWPGMSKLFLQPLEYILK